MLTDTWGGLTGNGGNGYLDLVIKLLPTISLHGKRAVELQQQ
jgi:hypothetical protein